MDPSSAFLVPQYGAALKELKYLLALPTNEIARLSAVSQDRPDAPDMAVEVPLDGR